MPDLFNNIGFPWLSVLIFSPLVALTVLLLLPGARAQRWWTLFFTTGEFAVSLLLYPQFNPQTAAYQFVEQHAWIAPWKIHYTVGVDGISLWLVLLTTLVMPLCVLASWTYIQTRLKEFLAALLLMETAMLGVFCALDFVLFFVFWEAMLIPMALIIGVWGGPRRIYAALKFFVYTMAGSVFLLVAIIALFLQAGTFHIPDLMGREYPMNVQFWVFLAFFISFAIKVPMFPFHTWLPAAHVEAPTAGSVLLASILLKMGGYGFVRLSLPITPQAAQLFAPAIQWLSVIAIIYGGLAALAQTDMKKLVAYSSVAHMGFVTLGIFTFTSGGLEGAMLQMINHGITTGALFICVGLLYERLHTREMNAAAGVGKFMPVFITAFGVFALSSMAFPGTNSFIGEFLVLASTFASVPMVAVAAVPGVIIAAAYLLRLLQRLAWGGTCNPDHAGIKDLSWHEIAALLPLFMLVFWLGLKPGSFVEAMRPSLLNLLQQVQSAAKL
ncbi:NADH-quinone oxidoreductase subunit M [Fontisphaera persica]|uniref:NADH-quinone oxidoreductase subunit M n=1 Tax=Fontisphaera persica TaxID=2974023 RepID=UPI0024C0BAFA|nr:NADH-quinone oxidoreductase subunit M [Fontisphaera persica]WCJ60392.1 NADH-quinone oxidoreductase subunit M [Fontisphaera persica]